MNSANNSVSYRRISLEEANRRARTERATAFRQMVERLFGANRSM